MIWFCKFDSGLCSFGCPPVSAKLWAPGIPPDSVGFFAPGFSTIVEELQTGTASTFDHGAGLRTDEERLLMKLQLVTSTLEKK